MRVLVTGAAGSIGSEIVRQHAEAGDRVLLFDNNEPECYDLYEKLAQEGKDVGVYIGDIRNPEDLKACAGTEHDIVYHAAAYKCVTPMQWFPRQSIDVNVVGTMNVLQYIRCKRLVFISTDKAAKAECVMGASKRLMELVVRERGGIVVRFGNVMNSRGSVIPLWVKQVKEGRPLTITDRRCKRFMMTIPEAVSLVREAGKNAEPGQTWIMDMGIPMSISKLAETVVRECGEDPTTYPMTEIGLRDGEVFEEILMTAEEKAKSKKVRNFYVF